MEAEPDVIVDDGDIVASTEINEVQDTVDPAIFSLANRILSPQPRKDHFPIYAHEIVPDTTRSSFEGSSPDSRDDVRSSLESSDSIEYGMDIETPPHRSIVNVVIPYRKFEPLPYSSTKSGLVYDVRMRFHTEPPCATINEEGIHPEDPRRIFAIYQALIDAGLVQDDSLPNLDPDYQLYRIEARNATSSEICLIHSKDHFLWVKNLRHKTDEDLQNMGKEGDSIYLHKLTFDCALLAAGGTIEACRAVVAGDVRNAIAVIRPPGHHAEHSIPGGFCFFNNVCIAARVCQRDYPTICRKILILDWDVHHGNGIQNAFYDNPNILYISLHVHKNGNFYPYRITGDHQHCGEGPGLGRNVNIPWADVGMGDGDYMFAFQQVVMPIATEFDPDLVIVAAGFDAAEGDLLGACHVSPPCYAHMTHMLMSLAGGKVAVCLEGGYNLSSIAKSALAVTRTLMGEPPDRLPDVEPSPLGVSTVQLVKAEQSRYWRCMYPKYNINVYGDGLKGERLHDVIRAWQSKVLFDEYHMATLEIYRERVSKSFEDQVLATPNYTYARSMLVILHDPPEVQGVPDPQTTKLDLHKYWLTDVSKSYIDWAVRRDFGVIDVNIPKHITVSEDYGGYVLPDDPDARAATRELIMYLWENYIEITEADDIFLLGIGTAYDAIVELLNRLDGGYEDRISHIFGFIATSGVHAVKQHNADDMIIRWYAENSHVFVAHKHHAWDNVGRKSRRKYGNLVRSSKSDLSEMLTEHRDTITSIMWTRVEESREGHEEQDKRGAQPEPGKAILPTDMNLNTRSTPQPQLRPGYGENDREFQPNNAPVSQSGSTLKYDRSRTKSPTKLPPLGYFNVSPPKRDGRDRTGSPRSPGTQPF